MGEGAFSCSLYLSPKVLEVSPIYSSSKPRLPHWYQYMAPLWLTIGSLSLGENRSFLMVLSPLKWVWMPYLPQIFLILSQKTLCVGYDNLTLSSDFTGDSLGNCSPPWLLAPSITSLVDLLSLFSTLFKAHLGYLILVRVFLRWSFSC